MLIHTVLYHRMQVTMKEFIQIAKDLPDRQIFRARCSKIAHAQTKWQHNTNCKQI